ncbi:hypothetical protein OR1_03835 [Geobacter sp. OR-1]|uniref:hypothetical protein n=1 Tax=Geobacter sp. OR-1 TaxID=1266765 RepID=UPI00054371E0|nr:hypothetical protein [Geobacter sp. OR-1]GAM11519.1 hypothetical protein OR1_03835 [Geobacter sp. OR-1]
MKKIIALTALIVISASSYAAAGALATNTVSNAGTAIYGGADATGAGAASSPLFKLSTGVSTIINFDAAGVGYAVFTKHVKGTKVFGTAYDSTAISYFTEAPGTLTTTNTGSATAVPSGWTSM